MHQNEVAKQRALRKKLAQELEFHGQMGFFADRFLGADGDETFGDGINVRDASQLILGDD